MTSISKNVYINKLADLVNKYNTYHSTIKKNPVDVNSSTGNKILRYQLFRLHVVYALQSNCTNGYSFPENVFLPP